MKEEHELSPHMKKFFDRLLELKEFVKKKYEESNNQVLKEIYIKLDSLIKQKGKE